jgi:hypothetical protein
LAKLVERHLMTMPEMTTYAAQWASGPTGALSAPSAIVATARRR